jgi:Flp pilus assembly pilin Flp
MYYDAVRAHTLLSVIWLETSLQIDHMAGDRVTGRGIPREGATAMFDVLKKLVRDEAGQDLAEYGIALAVIAGGIGLIAVAISGNVQTLWNKASDQVAAAAS